MEDLLLRNLFQGYQRWVRPIQHANDTVTVRFGLKISQLVDVVRTDTPYCPLGDEYSEQSHSITSSSQIRQREGGREGGGKTAQLGGEREREREKAVRSETMRVLYGLCQVNYLQDIFLRIDCRIL